MSRLVDTSVWSHAFRRAGKTHSTEVTQRLVDLIRDGHAYIIGPIRQELLSGVKDAKQFALLRDRMRAFPDISLVLEDFESAADYSNRCRAKGVQGSSIDFLICAVATRCQLSILTADRDFEYFSKVIRLDVELAV